MISSLYNDAFFRGRAYLDTGCRSIASWLVGNLNFDQALDIGCGNAHLLAALARSKKMVWGIEPYLESALPYIPPEIRHCIVSLDAATLIPEMYRSDLVICTEVAEHLPPGSEAALVGNFVRLTGRWLYFSAAPPGQPGGVGHINERPHEFWVEVIKCAGFAFDGKRTAEIRSYLDANLKDMRHLVKNAMIFYH